MMALTDADLPKLVELLNQIQIRMQQRRRTAAEWTTVNEVLRNGELGIETDTGRTKTGNGVSPWSALHYSSPGTSNLAGLADGQVLAWNANSKLWVPKTPSAGGDASGGGVMPGSLVRGPGFLPAATPTSFVQLADEDGQLFAQPAWPLLSSAHDPHWSKVVSLLLWDNNGAGPAMDATGRVWTVVGAPPALDASGGPFQNGAQPVDQASGFYLTSNSNADIDLTGDFCIEMWLLLQSTPKGDNYPMALAFTTGTNDTDFTLGHMTTAGNYTGDLSWRIRSGGATPTIPFTSSHRLDVWHYAKVSAQSGTVRTYFDYNLVDTRVMPNASALTNPDKFTVGLGYDKGVTQHPWQGKLCGIRITIGESRMDENGLLIAGSWPTSI